MDIITTVFFYHFYITQLDRAESHKYLLQQQLTTKLEDTEARRATLAEERRTRAKEHVDKAAAVRKRHIASRVFVLFTLFLIH